MLSFAGHEDWRLPNVGELQSIVDYGRANQAIDPVLGGVSDEYWSSTTLASSPRLKWSVDFRFGVVGTAAEVTSIFVRAVRGGR